MASQVTEYIYLPSLSIATGWPTCTKGSATFCMVWGHSYRFSTSASFNLANSIIHPLSSVYVNHLITHEHEQLVKEPKATWSHMTPYKATTDLKSWTVAHFWWFVSPLPEVYLPATAHILQQSSAHCTEQSHDRSSSACSISHANMTHMPAARNTDGLHANHKTIYTQVPRNQKELLMFMHADDTNRIGSP